MKPLVLMSGGLDSATVLWSVKSREPLALSIDYGQPHRNELMAAQALCREAGVPNLIVDLSDVYGSCRSGLFGGDDTVAADTVVPGRNLLFISVAAAVAEPNGFDMVLIGANRDDLEDYPDCRRGFLLAAESAVRAGGCSVGIMAPLLDMRKPEVVAHAESLGVPIGMTMSCYRGTNCGECAACKLREASGAAR